MQLYDRLSSKGKDEVLKQANACGVGKPSVKSARTPPGYLAVCVAFTKVFTGTPQWAQVAALEARGFYPDVLKNGYSTECSQAFVESKVFDEARKQTS